MYCMIMGLVNLSLYGQIIVEGKTVNSASGESIPYVNLGIINKDKGTVSDENGKFSLYIPKEFLNDSIRISSIGYKTKYFVADDLMRLMKKKMILELIEDIVELNEIVIAVKERKEKVLGNETRSKMMRGGFRNAELGNELGIKIKIKKSPSYITKFHAHITSNTGDQIKFRLNFYSIEKGLPGKKIITENIIFKIDTKADDFFICLEMIENKGEKDNEVFFSAGLLGNATVTRLTSQGLWNKLGSIGIGFSLTAEY